MRKEAAQEWRITMKKVDLHVHSTYSDGTNTPKELIKLAENEGLSAIALTDHDTLDGIPDALDAAKNSSVELIPGVELSTNFNNTEVHIVGLFLDHNNKQINDYLIYQRQSRIDRNIQMCQKFCDIGINITYDKMCELYPAAILAHPGLYHLGKDQMNALLEHVCNAGIDGIEAIYSTYKPADERYIRKIAAKHKLLISGGSDYHGANKPNIKLGRGLGHLFVPYEVLEKLSEKASEY